MNNKSIDGLTRRANNRTVGIENKRQKKVSVAKSRTIKPSASSAKSRKIGISVKDAQHDKAISEFLNSVKDDDPTNLVSELPMREETDKERKKRQKKESKNAATGSKPKKKKRVKRIILGVLGGILLIAIGVGIWAFIQGNAFISKVTGGGDLWSMFTADPDTPLEADPDSGRTNVLIFGTEGYSMDNSSYSGAWLTDTIMVASIDQDTGDVRTVSLPRDLKAKTCTSTSKLNEVYFCTYSKNAGTEASRAEYEKAAARALADQAEEILGIKIQYFAHANWQAIVQIVDALGGIDVAFVYQGTTWTGDEIAIETTDKRGLADYWNSSSRTYGIKFSNGEVAHLNGEQALAVARARNESTGYGAGGGNFSREQFQQRILQAILLKAKDTNFAADFIAALGILEAVGDNFRTDFKDTEMKTLFKLAGVIDMGSLMSVSLQDTDGNGTSLLTTGMLQSTNGQYYSYVYPKAGAGNYGAIHAYIKQKFSSDPLVYEAARIAVLNANSISGLASSEASMLENAGYTVVKTTNAPSDLSDTEGIVIYQLNKGMSGTAKSLKSLYSITPKTDSIPASLTETSYDFVIVLGAGYEGF